MTSVLSGLFTLLGFLTHEFDFVENIGSLSYTDLPDLSIYFCLQYKKITFVDNPTGHIGKLNIRKLSSSW